ncbi:MAG: hypothetical protein CMJ31_10405 [Phycisphaerae bacterium]|nr:hypothetical protein [Phycisphaerae bacterium]
MLIGAFIVYTLAIVGLGLYTGRRTVAESEDYFLGRRTLGPLLTALSSGASGSSAWVTMGLVGYAFTDGARAYWLIPGVLIGIGFNWFVLAGRMRDRAAELGAVTVPDLISMHYGEHEGGRAPVLRVMSVLVILSAMFLYVSAQMAAAGQVFSYAFPGTSYTLGVGIGVAIVLAYTISGGFRAACWTDLAQSTMMLVALVAMPIVLAMTLGERASVSAMVESDPSLGAFLPEFGADGGGLALLGFVLGSGALGINFGYPGQPHVLVRLMAMRDRSVVRTGSAIQLTWTVLIYLGAITTGVLARAAAVGGVEWAGEIGDGRAELALIIAANGVLPAVLSAFVLAAVFSAMASTADSQLIVAASAVSSDGYDRIVSHGHPAVGPWINRAAVLALGVGAGLLVLNEDVKIYTYVLEYGWAILGAAFGPQIVLALLWRGSTRAGGIAGMATGAVVAVGWKLFATGPTLGAFYNLTVAFMMAVIVHVAVSLATGGRGGR